MHTVVSRETFSVALRLCSKECSLLIKSYTARIVPYVVCNNCQYIF